MKRGLFICFLFVIFYTYVPLTFGAEVFDDYIYNGDTILADEIPIDILLTSSKAQLVVDSSKGFLINYGDCEQTEWFELCLGEYYPDSCDADAPSSLDCRVGSAQVEGGVSAAELTVDTYDAEVDVELTGFVSKNYLGETVEIEVEVRNTGAVLLKNILYEDQFPDDIILLDSSKGTIEINKLSYTIPRLEEDQTISFRYEFTSDVITEATVKPRLTFNYGGQTFEQFGSAKTITYATPITFDETFEGSQGEESLLTITATNNKASSVGATFTIEFPPEWGMSDSEFEFSGLITDEEVFDFEFTPDESGSFDLPIQLEVDGVESIDELTVSVSANETDEPEINFIFEPDTDVLHDRVIELSLFYETTGEVSLVDVAISSELFADEQYFFAELDDEELTKFFSKYVLLPKITTQTDYTIDIEGTFVGDVKQELSESFTLTVLPDWEAVSLSNDVDSSDSNKYTVEGVLTKSVTIPVRDVLVQHYLDGTTFSEKQTYSKFIDLLDVASEDTFQDELTALSYEVRMPYGVASKTVKSVLWVGDHIETSEFEIPLVQATSLPISVSFESEVFNEDLGIQQGTLTVSNSGNEVMENVFIDARLTPGIDIDRYPTFRLSGLEPGESVDFNFRLKPNVDAEFGLLHIFYESENGDAYYQEEDITDEFEGEGRLISKNINLANLTLEIYAKNPYNQTSAEILLDETRIFNVASGYSNQTYNLSQLELSESYFLPLIARYDDGYYSYVDQGLMVEPAADTLGDTETAEDDESETEEEGAEEVNQQQIEVETSATLLDSGNKNKLNSGVIFLTGLAIIVVVGVGVLVQRAKKKRLG